MLIVPSTKTITEYTLTLSDVDAAACLASPYEFADKLAEHLRAAVGDHAANGGGNGHKARKPKAESQMAVGRGRKLKAGQHYQCAHCPKTFKSAGFLARHMRRAHNAEAPEPPTAD